LKKTSILIAAGSSFGLHAALTSSAGARLVLKSVATPANAGASIALKQLATPANAGAAIALSVLNVLSPGALGVALLSGPLTLDAALLTTNVPATVPNGAVLLDAGPRATGEIQK
jgi:hypothetical protein